MAGPPGTLGFELSNSFVTYLGWLHHWGAPLTLIGDNQDQIRDARRQLVRIGIDRLEARHSATSPSSVTQLNYGPTPRRISPGCQTCTAAAALGARCWPDWPR